MAIDREAMALGREFEEDLAYRFGLNQTPGSGNQWHSKLDIAGMGARWSLKFTKGRTFTIDYDLIDEAREATGGLGGGGEIPIWGIRIGDPKYTFVMVSDIDFERMFAEEVKLVRTASARAEARRRLASTPQLLRGEGDEDADE